MYSKSDCIESLKRVADVYGNDITRAEYRESGIKPSDKTITKKLGSWNEAKQEAGLKVLPVGVNKEFRLPHHGWDRYGYEYCQTYDKGDRSYLQIHRLLAVAKFGFDAVCDMDVHHLNNIPWDNRYENIELIEHSEHASNHATERLETRERAENGQFL